GSAARRRRARGQLGARATSGIGRSAQGVAGRLSIRGSLGFQGVPEGFLGVPVHGTLSLFREPEPQGTLRNPKEPLGTPLHSVRSVMEGSSGVARQGGAQPAAIARPRSSAPTPT